jgi:hypothetical protein
MGAVNRKKDKDEEVFNIKKEKKDFFNFGA